MIKVARLAPKLGTTFVSALACLVVCLGRTASAQTGTLFYTSAARLGQESLSNSSYVIDNAGRLWVAGANDSGQLGIGSRTQKHTFTEVPVPPGAQRWTRIAAGRYHVIAIADTDKLYAWGVNSSSELGSPASVANLSPVRIQNPSGVSAWRDVSAGEDHSLALDDRGRIYGWGSNARGQLGSVPIGQSDTPLLIPVAGNGAREWIAMAAGAGFTVAVNDRGQLYVWGVDSLNVWSKTGGSPTPTLLAKAFRGYGPLATVAAGSSLWSAVDTRGTRSSWGTHPSGFQYNAFSVAVGGQHLIDLHVAAPDARRAHGVIVTEGSNEFGQLGNGSTLKGETTLNPPPSAHSWIAVAAGLHHSLAIADDGYLYGWGDNSYGQLGLQDSARYLLPARILRVGDSITLALRLDAPTWLPANPFSVHLAIVDTSTHLASVRAPILAHLVTTPTLWLTSSLDRQSSVSVLMPGDTANLQWSVYGDSVNGFATLANAYAYVTSVGSAPSFVMATVDLDVKRGMRPILGRVIDSLTRLPISDAIVRGIDSVDTTVLDGTFTSGGHGSLDSLVFSHENYWSQKKSLLIPYLPDTLNIAVALDSSDVNGVFGDLHAFPVGLRGLRHIYFPDSTIGYAIANDSTANGCSVFRTTDRGSSWSSSGHLIQPMDALVFADAAEGWVVGKAGLIAHTTDSGATWHYESPAEGGPDLHGISYANGYVWAVGDRGTILIREPNRKWRHDSTIAVDDLRAIHAFNRYKGIAVGARGYVYYRDLDHWIREPVSAVTTFTACFMPAFERAYLGDSLGDVYSINPADVYATLTKLPARMSGSLDPPGPVQSIFFINPAVGWAVGGTGAAIVTYDSGRTWAPVKELIAPQNTIDFWSLTGFSAAADTLSILHTHSISHRAIIRGRVTDPSGARGLAGAEITLHGSDSIIRVAYSNQKGNYVISGVPAGTATQSIDLYFWDTTGVWRAEESCVAAGGATITIDFQHPALQEVSPRENTAILSYAIQTADGVSIDTKGLSEGGSATVYDLLGESIASFSILPGTSSDNHVIPESLLSSGAYFIHVHSPTRSLFYKFVFRK